MMNPYYSTELADRAMRNFMVLKRAGAMPVDRAHEEAGWRAALGIEILGVEFRDAKMFLRLCREDGHAYEQEFTYDRGAA